MEKQKKTFLTSEVKIGIVVVLTIAILYFGLNYLKGINIFTPNSRYYVQYERVDGIVKTTHVLINGYQVGHVSDIRFDYSKEAPVTLYNCTWVQVPECAHRATLCKQPCKTVC